MSKKIKAPSASKLGARKTVKTSKASAPRGYATLAELMAAQGCETAGQFGRQLYKYTDCGPWVSFLVPTEPRGEIYYESERARQTDWWPHCEGLKIGSIVEGSDVEVGPIELLFPFEETELDAAVKALNDEASFYWERDNAVYFSVVDAQGELLLSAYWVNFDPAPKGSYENDQTDMAELALRAGQALLESEDLAPGELLAIPNTAYFVRREDPPDLLY
jgi:hypothetical protein